MRLNDTPAKSGTIVVGAGQTGALSLPWGTFTLVFEPHATPQKVQLATSPPEIVFHGTDNALGLATILNLPLSDGQTALLNLAVYSIGEGESVHRVIHYTVQSGEA